MTNEQNEFYTSISKYYSEIFPFQPMQLQFVKNRVGELSGKQILDIGCASGELAFRLAEGGAEVTGIDLNEDLLGQAKSKNKHSNLSFQNGNMLELETDFNPASFDVVLCFGNTLVHLQNNELILKMLKGVFSALKPGGCFLIQILNYDYILQENINELPLIENENIRFVRKYKFNTRSSLIRFHTSLEIKKENHIVNNETSLLALGSSKLLDLLKTSGFKNIRLYSNFKQEPFGGAHLPLVVSALK